MPFFYHKINSLGEFGLLKKILFGGETGLSHQANFGLALLRSFAGLSLAFAHGLGKLPPSEGLIDGTAKMGFPLPVVFAWAAAFSEFLGGIFLAFGLFTRVAAFFICFTMLVALTGVHWADPFGKKEMALLYFFIAFAFLWKGSGEWSLDSFLRK